MPVFFDSKDEGPEEKYPQRVKLKDIFGKMMVSSLFLEVPDRNSPDIEFTNTNYGEVMLDRDKIVLRTGRVSSEIVQKVRQMGPPVVVSLAVPTSLAIQQAEEAGITLVGAVRGRTFKVYTQERRMGL